MALIQWLKEFENLPYLIMATIFPLLGVFFLNRKTTSQNLPPSPPKLPIIGNLHQLGTKPHLSLQRLAKNLGPIFYLKLGQKPTIVVSSPKTAEKVLKTHDPVLANRPNLIAAKHLLYNSTDIAFAPYGDYWRRARKICILELLSAKRVQCYARVREDEVAHLVERVRNAGFGGTTNLTKLLQNYTENVVCRIVMGKDFSAEGGMDKYGFKEMIREFESLLGGFSIGDFFPFMESVHAWMGMKKRLHDTFQRLDSFLEELIKEHMIARKETQAKNLVDVLLDVQKSGSADVSISMDNVKAIISDMFGAGTSTTSSALDWAMTELITHPQHMQKAQTEVRSNIGEQRTVLESDLPKLHYIKAVVKEILRLHPPAPLLLPRESLEDVIIDGYKIPAKTCIIVNAWAIGRDADTWENPDTFEPQRFIESNKDFKGKDFDFIPFGAGRRGCPGINFGIATIELALAQLLHNFDWELPNGTQVRDLDMNEAFGLSMHRISDMIVVAKPWIE